MSGDVFVRTTRRSNKDGRKVEYLQLAQNHWDPVAKRAKTQVLYNFGRAEDLDPAGIERLIASLSRLLDDPDAAGAAPPGGEDTGQVGLSFDESRPLGGAWALDALWERLGIGTAIRKLLENTRRDELTERVLFALVANRALAPASKLAAADWASNDVAITGLGQVSDDACYRAMDFLSQITSALEEEVFWATVTLLDSEVDLLFFDTTSTYFETETPDAPVARDAYGHRLPQEPEPADAADAAAGQAAGETAAATEQAEQADAAASAAGFRTQGNSKDARPDLPQVVIGMAVTRAGIPVRCWCWPGNAADQPLIRQVRDEMTNWTLSRVVWVADRGFASAENRRYLRRGGQHYILGEKLRSGSAEATAALARPGRYRTVADNLQVKEVKIAEGERFVVCYNPEQATRDAAIRELMTSKLTELITDTDQLSADKRAELRGKISTKPGLARFLRTTGSGLLRVDKRKVAAEAKLDGKYLLRSSDPALSAEDIALGYKQLLAVERGWREMKTTLELRPVYHRLEQRIRTHVTLCWLALLLIRVAENTTEWTWHHLRPELQRLCLGAFTGPAGSYHQTTEPTPTQRELLTQLGAPIPGRIQHLDPSR
jgi:hypothetical protein